MHYIHLWNHRHLRLYLNRRRRGQDTKSEDRLRLLRPECLQLCFRAHALHSAHHRLACLVVHSSHPAPHSNLHTHQLSSTEETPLFKTHVPHTQCSIFCLNFGYLNARCQSYCSYFYRRGRFWLCFDIPHSMRSSSEVHDTMQACLASNHHVRKGHANWQCWPREKQKLQWNQHQSKLSIWRRCRIWD